MFLTSFIRNGKGHGKRWLLLFSLVFSLIAVFYLPICLRLMPDVIKQQLADNIEIEENADFSFKDAFGQKVEVLPIKIVNREVVLPKLDNTFYGTNDDGEKMKIIVDTIHDMVDPSVVDEDNTILFSRKTIYMRFDGGETLQLPYPKNDMEITKERILNGAVYEDLVPVFSDLAKWKVEQHGVNLYTVLVILAVFMTPFVFIVLLILSLIAWVIAAIFNGICKAGLDSNVGQPQRLGAMSVIVTQFISVALSFCCPLGFTGTLAVCAVIELILVLLTKSALAHQG